jgi:hypothetical protein
MATSARVLADSIPHPNLRRLKRITTLEVTFPRFILAEFNTHRVLSRNSASSRAIPPEKQIARIRDGDYFVPTFGSRVKGMGQGDDLSHAQQRLLRLEWRENALRAADRVEYLIEHGSDKSHANRLLEPFLWHTVIVTATEWENFFALRDHEAAQPEIRETAQVMQRAMQDSEPVYLNAGDWHLPLVSDDERADEPETDWAAVSAGRCARVSFDTHDSYEDPADSLERASRLSTMGHWSPFEHPAQLTLEPRDDWGNFTAPWLQYRKMFKGEAVFAG